MELKRAFTKFVLGAPVSLLGLQRSETLFLCIFEGSNHCSNPTAVRYVIVFNLRYVKNVKLKHFRGSLSSSGPGTSSPSCLSFSAALTSDINNNNIKIIS